MKAECGLIISFTIRNRTGGSLHRPDGHDAVRMTVQIRSRAGPRHGIPCDHRSSHRAATVSTPNSAPKEPPMFTQRISAVMPGKSRGYPSKRSTRRRRSRRLEPATAPSPWTSSGRAAWILSRFEISTPRLGPNPSRWSRSTALRPASSGCRRAGPGGGVPRGGMGSLSDRRHLLDAIRTLRNYLDESSSWLRLYSG